MRLLFWDDAWLIKYKGQIMVTVYLYKQLYRLLKQNSTVVQAYTLDNV